MRFQEQQPIIKEGAEIAKRLKDVLHADKTWDPNLAFLIGGQLATLKRLAKKYYPDASELEILHEMKKWSDQDLRDGLEELAK
jgi:hypothetical protein